MRWRSDELVAWTSREGPPRPPGAGSPVLWTALAVVLATTFVGMVSSDALCPEHRAWVEGLGIAGFLTIVVAGVGLVRRSTWAPGLTAVASAFGIAIGVLDAAHDATRGWIITVAFATVLLVVSAMLISSSRLRAWDRRVLADVGSPVGDATLPPQPDPVPSERQETRADSL